MKKRYTLAIVSWNDAHETSGDFDTDTVNHAPAVQHTAGFVVKRDRKGITLATEVNGDGSGVRTTNFIPRGMIVRVRECGGLTVPQKSA